MWPVSILFHQNNRGVVFLLWHSVSGGSYSSFTLFYATQRSLCHLYYLLANNLNPTVCSILSGLVFRLFCSRYHPTHLYFLVFCILNRLLIKQNTHKKEKKPNIFQTYTNNVRRILKIVPNTIRYLYSYTTIIRRQINSKVQTIKWLLVFCP